MPARNEAALLPRLFAALDMQSGLPSPFVLCLFLDGCTDASEAAARSLSGRVTFPVVFQRGRARRDANAGRARRAALAVGQAHLSSHAEGALLSTDADSVPANDWVAAALRALETVDVVAGRIVRDGARPDELQTRLETYYDRLYVHRRRIDPVPWEAGPLHHHTGGANLAFRASAYSALGGFGEHASGEDARIVDAAHRCGLRVRRDARVVVRTSARRDGRALGGLASALNALASQRADTLLVTHPDDEAWRFARHAEARRVFDAGITAASAAWLGSRLGKDAEHVREFASRQPNGEAFATCITPERPEGLRRVSLEEAEVLLDAREHRQALAAA